MSRSRTAEYNDDEFDQYLAAEIRREDIRAEKKKIDAEVRELAKQTSIYVYFTGKAISDLSRFLDIITFLNDQLTQFFRTVLPWAAVITMIFSFLLKMVIAAFISNESIPTRIVKGLAATTGLGLGITAIVLATALVAIAAVAIDLTHKVWEIGDLVYQRFWGGWKHKRELIPKIKDEVTQSYENYSLVYAAYTKAKSADSPDQRLLIDLQDQMNEIKSNTLHLHRKVTIKENKERVRNAKLANSIHTAATSGIVLIGLILAVIPFTAPIGSAILIGSAIYGVMDTFNINPFRYVANKLLGDPFSEKAPASTFEQLKVDLDNKAKLGNTSKLALPVAKSFDDSTKNIYASIGNPEVKVADMDPNSVEIDKTYLVKTHYEPAYFENKLTVEPATRTINPVEPSHIPIIL